MKQLFKYLLILSIVAFAGTGTAYTSAQSQQPESTRSSAESAKSSDSSAAAKKRRARELAAKKRKARELAAKKRKARELAAKKRREREIAAKKRKERERVAGSANLSWTIPKQRENGDSLSVAELRRYEIYFTSNSGKSDTIRVDNPTKTNITIANLQTDTYYFAMAAVDENGIFSELSNEVLKTVK